MLTAIIQPNSCMGCHRCVETCPVDAIVGTKQYMHTVLTSRCIGCKLCLAPCPVDCINITKLNLSSTKKSILATKAKKRYQNRQIRLQKQAPKTLSKYANKAEKQKNIQDYIKIALQQVNNKNAS